MAPIPNQLSTLSVMDLDEDDVNVLEETLLKVGSLTDQISTSLHKLGISAKAAEHSIKPIAGTAQMLTVYEDNIENSIRVVDGIKDYARLTEECNEIIYTGPAASGIKKYSMTIARLDNAIKQLQSSNLQTFSRVVDQAESLKRQGILQMRDYLRQILSRSFKPIDAGEYLANNRLFPILTKDTVTTTRQLYAYFENSQNEQVDDVYFEIATKYISASLKGLAASCEPKTSDTAPVPPPPGGPGNGTQTNGFASVSIAGSYEKGSNRIVRYAEAYCRLMIGQVTNARQLFDNSMTDEDDRDENSISKTRGEDMVGIYFEQIMNSTISEFISLANKINEHVSKHMQTDSMLSFELLEALNNVINMIKKFSPRVPARLSQAATGCQTTTHAVFRDFIRYVESRVDAAHSNVILENGVSDATVDVMTRLKRISTYSSIALVSMASLGSNGWFPNGTKPRWASVYSTATLVSQGTSGPAELLSWFFSDCIDALIVCLEIRAKSLQKKNTQIGFFLLTNLALVEHYVSSSEIFKIMGPVGAERLEKLRKRGVNLFLEGWNNAASLLMDVTIVKGTSGKGLSKNDREAIKEKFRTFNAEFEVLVKQHKAYNITNQALRQQLAKEVRFISPLYHRYYDKHVGGDFSKHVDKYIKYNKQEFDRILESLE